MQIFLGLGSNLGDRREHLRRGIAELERAQLRVRRISPVVESPALLPPDAPADWNLPFLNLVLDCETGDLRAIVSAPRAPGAASWPSSATQSRAAGCVARS